MCSLLIYLADSGLASCVPVLSCITYTYMNILNHFSYICSVYITDHEHIDLCIY